MFNGLSHSLLVLLAINTRQVCSIVGGDPVAIQKVSGMVSIIMDGEHRCGGAIIAERWVLTAAHCILAAETVFQDDVQVRSGSSKRDSGGVLHRTRSLIKHERYSESTNDYDIGLIEVDPPFKYDNYTQPMEVPGTDEVKDSSWIRACGWGYFERSKPKLSDTLECIELPRVDKKECKEDYVGQLTLKPRQVCYGYRKGGRDTCKGDSGGPAQNRDGQLVGITSVGTECADSNLPGIYTDVPPLKPWIVSRIS